MNHDELENEACAASRRWMIHEREERLGTTG